MTDHINIDNPVIAFADNTSNSIEQIAESLRVKYLPPQGMSRASQLIPFLPFGSSTLWAWSRDGRFPAPVKLSPTMTAWRNADVIEWLESHAPTTSEV
ncbi:MAG: AlpA family phage regulatory protein [Psychrobacter glacincola]